MLIGTTTFGCDAGRSGIGRYTTRLLDAMARTAHSDRIEIIAHHQDQSTFLPSSSPASSSFLTPGLLTHPVLDIAWHQTVLPPLAAWRHYDLLLLPAANRRLPSFAPCPTVGTFHDAGILHIHNKYSPLRRLYLNHILPPMVRRLNHLLTVSEYSKQDLIHHFGIPADKITVTPLAADREYYRPRDPEHCRAQIASLYDQSEPYLIYVSRLEHPAKNHVRLIQAFSQARQKYGLPHQLLLAGGDWSGSDAIYRAARRSSQSQAIHFLGFVPDSLLPHLYGAAEAMIFPSLFEGFGLPILEAMSSGLPVATSNAASLPEVAGDAALFFDPHDVDAMAEQIARLASDPALRLRLREKGLRRANHFSWERTAHQTWQVLRNLDALQ